MIEKLIKNMLDDHLEYQVFIAELRGYTMSQLHEMANRIELTNLQRDYFKKILRKIRDHILARKPNHKKRGDEQCYEIMKTKK